MYVYMLPLDSLVSNSMIVFTKYYNALSGTDQL